MAGEAFSTSEARDPTAERTELLAAQIADAAREEARLYLGDLMDLVDAGTVDRMAARKAEIACERYKSRRKAGLENDFVSLATGIRVYVNPDSIEEIRKSYEERRRHIPSLKFTAPEDKNAGLMFFDFPDGGFFDQSSLGVDRIPDLAIGSRVSFEGQRLVKAGLDEPIPQRLVVKIVGYNGEFWQNAQYHPDGSLNIDLEVADLIG